MFSPSARVNPYIAWRQGNKGRANRLFHCRMPTRLANWSGVAPQEVNGCCEQGDDFIWLGPEPAPSDKFHTQARSGSDEVETFLGFGNDAPLKEYFVKWVQWHPKKLRHFSRGGSSEMQHVVSSDRSSIVGGRY